jgi:FkbM family methyltransferase
MWTLKARLGRFVRRQISQAMIDPARDTPVAGITPDSALAAVRAQLQMLEQKVQSLTSQMRSNCYVGDGRVLTVTNRGDRMYVDGRDIMIAPGILSWGGWEDNTTALLERFLKPGMVWADVGANCGYFTVIGHKLVRANDQSGETYAFEISPDNFRLCVDNLALSWMAEGSQVEQMAVYSEDTRLTFHIFTKYAVNSGISGMSEQHAEYVGDRQRAVEVKATTLDSYFLAKARRPSFMKIDIEGGEWHALQGARGLIAAEPELRILIEWSPGQLAAAGTEPRALAELIPALGLKCFNAEEGLAPLDVAGCLAINRTTMFLLCRSNPDA